MRIAENLHVIDLPEFAGCHFRLKVTILRMGVHPCPVLYFHSRE